MIVPYIPSSMKGVRLSLELARINSKDVVYDLGAGDGRVVIEAAKRGALGVAVEIRKDLAMLIIEKARLLGLDDRLIVIEDDFFNVYLGHATIIYQYLYPNISRRLADKYCRELRVGTRILSYQLPIPEWIPIRVKRFIDENNVLSSIYLYIMGLSDPCSNRLENESIPPIHLHGV